MKLEELIVPGVLLVGVYLMKDTLAGLLSGITGSGEGDGTGAGTIDGGGPAPGPSTYYWKPSQEYYPAPVYQTPLPVIPSEPDVSSGIPIPTSKFLLCPDLDEYPRYPGDEQLCCQCPSQNIQCGNPASMTELMLGDSAADIAWRGRFCGL